MNNLVLLCTGLVASLLVGLIAFAVTTMVKYTDGPLDIFLRVRVLVRLEIPVAHPIPALAKKGITLGYKEDEDPVGFFAKLFHCYWCLTSWISILFTYLLFVVMRSDSLSLFFFVWFAAIGVSGFLHSYSEG